MRCWRSAGRCRRCGLHGSGNVSWHSAERWERVERRRKHVSAQRRQFALRQHQKRSPAVKPPPRRRRPRRLNAAAVACRLSLPGASRYHNGAAPPLCTSPTPETHPSDQAATTAAQTAPPKRGSSCARPQAACRAVGRRFIPKHTQVCT